MTQAMIETRAWLRANGFLHTGERALVPFANWDQVLDYATTHGAIWYHAPLDRNPVRVDILRVFRNGKIRLRHGDCSFTADAGHLDRFRMRGVRPLVTPSLPQPDTSKGV